MIYLDTCALMKLVHPEPETRALREFLKAQAQVPKFTATVTLAELPRAVRRANHDQAGQASELLAAEREQAERLLDTLRMIDVTRAVLADAAEADGPFLRTLDAVHLVAAARIRGGLSAFVTYDRRLASAAQDVGLPALSPG
ncbi:MAG TPA: type II toxin-antitoxin system VapC family toxin [Trebonia sp.]|nr:type II toxin-antitoxin system VapC family toxin [Trebonia sp.]